jgi:hypothetical protein
MKTMIGFTTGALATLVLATAAYADVQDQLCYWSPWNRISWGGRHVQGTFGVRAGRPCRVPNLTGLRHSLMTVIKAEIVEPPHNGTAVARNDGDIYFYPKSGFTGKDSMTVRYVSRRIRPTHGFVTYAIDVF